MTAVANHQPATLLVQLVRVRLDIGRDLGSQRGREHLPRAVAHDLIQQRPADNSRRDAGLRLLLDYREHGRTFPNQRGNAGP